ncbi:hypothetical protein TIFTF001_020745 [Ficus carica]|uniref:Uncharacterized protein n=1 Tax=Ficus carica TaxID=3494 RepID=A0AA88AFI5_FICCA|nr:hypothetical protein TIFTF001_020745 [Ficus carica]
MKRIVFAAFTCILSLGGAMVGTIHGALKGQTTETGFLKGAIIGGIVGAVAAIQLLDSAIDGQPFSKSVKRRFPAGCGTAKFGEWKGFHGLCKSCNAESLSVAGGERRRECKKASQVWAFLPLGMYRPMADSPRLLSHL